MIFRSGKHYENENKFSKLECVICFENKNNGEYNIILNLNNDYYKTCNCKAYIHIACLNKWYLIAKSCPICRNKIIKKTEKSYINNFLKKKQLIINKLTDNYLFFLIINTIIKIIHFIQFIVFIKFISIIYNIIKL